MPHLGERAKALGLNWYHLPIVDVSVPDDEFEEEWETAGAELRDMLSANKSIVVHCRGGLGRAGTVAARLLVELGEDARDAISRVRAARPHAIETEMQERYVMNIARNAARRS